MEVSELLLRRVGENARRLMARLSRFKTVFTLASFAYCAVHWLLTHSFSICMVSGALVFGATVATSIAWLSGRFSSSST
jgi:hypothetical protein